jgi:hypothetical protein
VTFVDSMPATAKPAATTHGIMLSNSDGIRRDPVSIVRQRLASFASDQAASEGEEEFRKMSSVW